MLVFEERGKPEYAEKNLSEQGREPKNPGGQEYPNDLLISPFSCPYQRNTITGNWIIKQKAPPLSIGFLFWKNLCIVQQSTKLSSICQIVSIPSPPL